MRLFRIFSLTITISLLAFLAQAGINNSSPAETSPIVISQNCGSPETASIPENNSSAIDTYNDSGLEFPLRLLNWNIEKTNNRGWQQDLATYSKDFSLVLLQEAASHSEMNSILSAFAGLSMAPGYHTGEVQTGVLTASSYPATRHCYLQHKEPWLRSLKTAQLSWYPIKNSSEHLLVVNIHSVNFTLGVKDYKKQIQAFRRIAEQHEGPMIISGDFNSWSNKRLLRLQELAQQLGLVAVNFTEDKRTQIFGHTIDHIYTRGLIHQGSHTELTASSDHNPLFAELNIPRPERIAMAGVSGKMHNSFENPVFKGNSFEE